MTHWVYHLFSFPLSLVVAYFVGKRAGLRHASKIIESVFPGSKVSL